MALAAVVWTGGLAHTRGMISVDSRKLMTSVSSTWAKHSGAWRAAPALTEAHCWPGNMQNPTFRAANCMASTPLLHRGMVLSDSQAEA